MSLEMTQEWPKNGYREQPYCLLLSSNCDFNLTCAETSGCNRDFLKIVKQFNLRQQPSGRGYSGVLKMAYPDFLKSDKSYK